MKASNDWPDFSSSNNTNTSFNNFMDHIIVGPYMSIYLNAKQRLPDGKDALDHTQTQEDYNIPILVIRIWMPQFQKQTIEGLRIA